MLQAIVVCSDKKFQITEQSECSLFRAPNCMLADDANDFLQFFLNTLHIALNGTKKTSSSVVYKTFRGRVRQFSRKILPVNVSEESARTLLDTEEYRGGCAGLNIV